jgi:DNA modification methylase
MVTKDYIDELKTKNLDKLYSVITNTRESSELHFILENLGYLPSNFNGGILAPFIVHSNDKIRFWAVKNIGKLSNPEFIGILERTAKHDNDSMIRREAVSSIGRMRTKKAIPSLIELLEDTDPKIILQAIRALLVFKSEPKVQTALKAFINHPNEMVQSVIKKEFFKVNETKKQEPHPTSPNLLRNLVVYGDVRETLREVSDESIHLTFTSPPYYNARDYSIYESYKAYLDFLMEVFNQVHRVTKEGRFLIVNTSPIIIPRMSRAHSSKRYPIPFDLHTRLVNNGWEFIDDIVWLKPETSVKNRNAGFLQHRKPLGYKPNAVTEYLMVYRKQTEKLLDWNIHQYDNKTVNNSKIKENYETSNVWKIDPTFDRVHTAVFPLELCNRVIKFYSYKNDLVFDPFGGSGTLGKAASRLGRYFFLTEQEKKYVERMKENLITLEAASLKQPRFLSLSDFRKSIYGEGNDNNN